MALINRPFTFVFLMMGVLLYIFLESLRIRGVSVPFISSLTVQASRPRDKGRFVMGPVSLGLGAMLVLALFPIQTAAIAIYALAFGDGFASLLGKPFGRLRPAFLFGKSIEGSLACFFAVFYCTWSVSHSLSVSLAAALTGALVEALPLKDLDNIAMPLAVALVVLLI
jgi:dolichol kinase